MTSLTLALALGSGMFGESLRLAWSSRFRFTSDGTARDITLVSCETMSTVDGPKLLLVNGEPLPSLASLIASNVVGIIGAYDGVEELEKAIASVAAGRVWLTLDMWRALAASSEDGDSDVDALSSRELEILKLAATGLQSKQIAARLRLSLSTIKRHLYDAYSKLGVHTRRDALSKLGLIK